MTMQLDYKVKDISGLGMFFPPMSVARDLNIFWISIILYSAGYAFSSSIYALAAAFQGLQLIGIFGVAYSFFSLASARGMNVYFFLLFTVYTIWQIFSLARGSFEGMDYMEVKSLIFNANYGLSCMFVPLVVFLPVSLANVKKIFDASFILFFLYVVFTVALLTDLLNPDSLDAFSREALEGSVKFMAFPVCFILLTFDLHSNKRKLFALAVFALSIALSIVRARRGILLMDMIALIFAFAFYFFKSSKKLGWVLAFIYLAILVYQLIAIDIGIAKIGFFENLLDKGTANTRTYVENCFFSSMSTLDWIVGKGYNVGYQCKGIDDSIFKDGVRKVIETDYLQLIMVGGLVNVVLLLAMLLPAVFLGLFYSSNLLCKKAATWILIWMFFLYPSNGYTFSMFHISMWLMVALCYNGKFRSLSDQTIINYFTKNIKINANEKA